MTLYIAALIAVALLFDYINGFHDAANSVATVVSTRVLSPVAAVAWAAAFNFIAFLLYPSSVSASVAKGVAAWVITDHIILATLLGAIAWGLITWWKGIPSSSSHALMGGLAGASLARTPHLGILNARVFGTTVAFILIAPVMGLVLGNLLMRIVQRIGAERHPATIERFFRRGQIVSAALYSLGHGGNDAQKTMGIITALLISAGLQDGRAPLHPKLWVVLACHAAIALGTMSGGWRIIKTMGMRITKLKPVGGFCAETAGAVTLGLATLWGIPVSTTHTITGAIVGVGRTEGRASAVRWGVAARIVWAWLFTIPAAGGIAALTYLLLRGLTGRP